MLLVARRNSVRWTHPLVQKRARRWTLSQKSAAGCRDRRSMSGMVADRVCVLDKFAWRQFLESDGEEPGSSNAVGKISFDKGEFAKRVNEELVRRGGESALVAGYAPFCKHLFMDNFCGASCLDLEITDSNRHLLHSCYEARRKGELPVLVRHFKEHEVAPVPQALYLDIIFYSREQINKENAALPDGSSAGDALSIETAPWGIISIKPQNVLSELPMTPATMLRNALGKEEGGSGVSLDRDEYTRSVDYWQKHAAIK